MIVLTCSFVQSNRRAPKAHNNGTMDDLNSRGSFSSDIDNSTLWSGPVGSFGGNDTPPRSSSTSLPGSARASPQASPKSSPRAYHAPFPGPPYHSQYATASSSQPQAAYGYRPTGPHAMPYAQGSRPQHVQHAGYSGPYPFPEGSVEQIWNSPPQFDEAFAPPPPPLPRSPSQTGTTKDALTPEKMPPTGHLQSTPPMMLNRSPLQSSPHLGLAETFGMINSPDAQLKDAFSPVGPSFIYFDQEGPISRFPSHQATSGDYASAPMPYQRGPPASSPFTGFIHEFCAPPPALQGVARSPLMPGSSRSTSRGPSSAQVTASSTKKVSTSRPIRASPVAHSSDVRVALWQEPRSATSTPGSAMRLTLGGTTGGRTLTQRSLEGINNMVRGQGPSNPMQRHSTPVGRSPYHQLPPSHRPPPQHQQPPYIPQPPPPPPPHIYQQPTVTATPKASSGMMGGPRHPQHRPGYPPPMGSATKPPPRSFPPSASRSAEKKPPPSSAGKENNVQSTSPPADAKRMPCNCRKSKCLKLYCECFSARIYCEGCKCLDCKNIPDFETDREKAMKDARTKNPRAFDQQAGGCRCKRSECLKKYCEVSCSRVAVVVVVLTQKVPLLLTNAFIKQCFQAGDLCSNTCKCIGCENRAGSQKLIDKRRKMKDIKGAEFAMRVAEETWKAQGGRQRKSGATKPDIRATVPTSTRGHPRTGPPTGYVHPGFVPPHMMGMGYSPMAAAPAVTPGYSQPRPTGKAQQSALAKVPASIEKTTGSPGTKRPPPVETTKTPKNRPVRIEFDVSVSRKRRKKGLSNEDVFDYFGPYVAKQPKITALGIFSFLSNEDVYKAASVCKTWKSLAMDEEMWKFD